MKKGGFDVGTVRVKLPTTYREIADSTSPQCVPFFSSSSSEWAIVEDSISLVVSHKNPLSKKAC